MADSQAVDNGNESMSVDRGSSSALCLQESNSFFTDIQCQWQPVCALQFVLAPVWNLAVVVAIALDNLVQTALMSKPNTIDLVSWMLIVADSCHLHKLK